MEVTFAKRIRETGNNIAGFLVQKGGSLRFIRQTVLSPELEKLKPMEVELRKLEGLVRDIIDDMDHLKDREEKMRNTNGKS